MSIFISLLIFAGHVQFLTYTFFLAPIYFFTKIRSAGKFDPALIAKVSLSSLLGVGIGAVQLLPTFEFFGRSIRAEESFVSAFNYGLSDWSQIIRLWAADFFGNPVTGNHFAKVDYSEFSSYLGVLTIPLVLSFVLSKAGKKFNFFIYLFFASLFLAFDNPVSRFLFGLPIPLLTYSSASRIFFLTNFSAATLVAAGIENLGNDKEMVKKLFIFSLLFLGATIVAPAMVESLHRPVSLRNALYYSGPLALLTLTCLLLRKKIPLLTLLIVIIFALDLGRYYTKYNTFVPPHLVFPTTPVIDYLKEEEKPFRFAKENTNIFPSNSWIAYGLESVEGYDPLSPANYAHYFNLINGGSYRDQVSRILNLEHFNRKYLDASNVKFVLAKSTSFQEKLALQGFEPVFNDRSVIIFKNPDAQMRAYFVRTLRFAEDKEDLIDIIDTPLFNPGDEAAIVASPFAAAGQGGEVVSIDHRDNLVEIKTKNDKDSFLVLSDSYDPGWKAYVNGKETKVYEVNGALRGVVVPAGGGTILFRYEPQSLKTGLIISLVSVIILLIWRKK